MAMESEPRYAASDTGTVIAQIGERVSNLSRRQTDYEGETRAGFRSIEASISQLTSETRSAIAGLSSQISDRNKPQWQALSVILAAAVAIGGLAYWPVREATADLKVNLQRQSEQMVTRTEMEWRTARSAEDRQRTELSLRLLQDDLVPRGEHTRVWQNYDQRFVEVQRQLDELKQQAGSVYSARDVILDLRERLDRLERLRQSQSPSATPAYPPSG